MNIPSTSATTKQTKLANRMLSRHKTKTKEFIRIEPTSASLEIREMIKPAFFQIKELNVDRIDGIHQIGSNSRANFNFKRSKCASKNHHHRSSCSSSSTKSTKTSSSSSSSNELDSMNPLASRMRYCIEDFMLFQPGNVMLHLTLID